MARIDQWLWAVRLFKTRSQATQACRNGKILLDGLAVKAAHEIKPGQLVAVRQVPVNRRYRVLGLALKRVAPALARTLVEEITPAADLEKLALFYRDPLQVIYAMRTKGTGRPTKRERRSLEKFKINPEQ